MDRTAIGIVLFFLLPGLIALAIGICNEASAAAAAKSARERAAEEARRKAAAKAEETARKRGEAAKQADEKKRIAAEKAAAREAERERIAQQRHENAMRRAEEMHALRLRQANELKAIRAASKSAAQTTPQNATAEEKTPCAVKETKPAAPSPKAAADAPRTNATQPFAGEFVAFTGTCPKLNRRAMITHTNRLGGQGYETINTRCTLLVIGEKPGKNQLNRAAEWNVKTITWQEWCKRAFGEDFLPAPKAEPEMTLDAFAKALNAA